MTFKKLGKQLTEVGGIVVGSIVLFGVLMTIGVWGGEQGQIFFCGIGLLLAMFVIAWSLVGIQAVFEELKSRDKVLHFLATDHSSKLYLLNGLFDLEEAGCPVFNVVRETRAKLLLEEYK